MQPIMMITLAAVIGVPLGLWLRRDLATLRYRDGDEHDLPQPGPRWWVVWTSTLALVSLAAAAYLSSNPLVYLPLLPLAATGSWLAAVDLDVLRIPDRVLVPAAVVTLLAVVATAAAQHRWSALVLPVAAALTTGAMFAAVHFVSKGGIGFGDVKLASVMGLSIGPLGLGPVWLAVITGSLGALVWAKTTRRVGPIPYGPWLLSGYWLALVTSAFPR